MKPLPGLFIENILEAACAIQAIPAPTFNESKRAEFFLKQFQSQGLEEVQIDPVGNVLGKIPGTSSGRPLVVSAHMDSVHPLETPLVSHRLEDRIIGPGIGDNALGLAAILGLISFLRMYQVKLPGDLWLAINVGEEGLGNLCGIRAIVDRFQDRALAYLVVEGMGLGTIIHRGLGVERYRMTVSTAGGHSWVDYGQVSAIHELCKIVARLDQLELPRSPRTTLNAGIVQGGTSVNTIAAKAWMELDLRSEDEAALASLVQEVRRIVGAARRAGVQIDMEQIGKRIAGQLESSHPLVQLAGSALAEAGVQARLDIASTDANLPLSRGYPSICIGITNGNFAHTQDEYILTGQVGSGLAQLYQIVTQAWKILD